MISGDTKAEEDEKKMAKKYYKCVPSMTDPNVKCPVRESEIRLDLEERIRETEDNIELAALVGAWCQVAKDKAVEGVIQYGPLEARTGTAIKENMVNFLFFVLGAATGIASLMLLTRL